MKNHIIALSSALALAGTFCLSSCDDIAESDRIEEVSVDSITFKADTITRTIEGEDFTFVKEHRMYFEDYTGDLCVNCPTLSTLLHGMIENNHYSAVVVEVHPTYTGLSTGFYVTPEANAYATQFSPTAGISGLPGLAIDRKPMSTGIIHSDPNNMFDSEIRGVASTIFANYAKIYSNDEVNQVDLALNITADGANSYSVKTAVWSNTDLSNVKLQLLVTEDGIIGYQQTPQGFSSNFTHNNTLRTAINGTWGEAIAASADEPSVYANTLSLEGKTWVADNCKVVAFVYNATTYEVLNVVETKLTSAE